MSQRYVFDKEQRSSEESLQLLNTDVPLLTVSRVS